MRVFPTLAAVALLAAGAVATEHRLRSLPRPDPLGKELLYLPSVTALRLASLGNEGLAADLVYMWAIQYYSTFAANERFLYLEKVFDIITDLDPRHFDAYRLGALIMQVEAPGDPEERKRAVVALFDKGIAAMPDDWRLAETAAWDCYLGFRDVELAIRYAELAAQHPRAPHRIRRAFGVWRSRTGGWTIEDSIAYWEGALAEATTPGEVLLTTSHLYDAAAARDRQILDPLLQRYREQLGRCPSRLDELVSIGWLYRVPLDYAGNPFGIDERTCTLLAHKRIRS